MDFLQLKSEIQYLVAKDNIPNAIKLLAKYFDNDNEKINDIILQSAKYHSMQNALRKGLISYSEVETSSSHLRDNILQFIEWVEEEMESKKNKNQLVKKIEIADYYKNKNQLENYEYQLRISLARISILWILKEESSVLSKLNITEICKETKINRKEIVDSLKEMEKSEIIIKHKIADITCYKISEKGKKQIKKFENSLIFKLHK